MNGINQQIVFFQTTCWQCC